MAAVPLKSGDQVIGAIGMAYGADSQRTFGDAEVEVMSRFAELASLALDNARLFAQSQDQTRRLALLNEMGRRHEPRRQPGRDLRGRDPLSRRISSPPTMSA